jgi:thiol-disulfide isomerase/thioredoxin
MSDLTRWLRVARRLALVGGLSCAWGCAPRADEPASDSPNSAPPAGEVDAVQPIRVKLVDRADYDSVIADQQGRVVLVDFWATWCLPCMQQLPHTLELAARRSDQDVVVATVNMDEPANQHRVEQILSERGAGPVINLMTRDGGGSQAMDDFEIDSGALPHYKLYDRAGKLRRTFEVNPAAPKQFTTDDIDRAVEELLGER